MIARTHLINRIHEIEGELDFKVLSAGAREALAKERLVKLDRLRAMPAPRRAAIAMPELDHAHRRHD